MFFSSAEKKRKNPLSRHSSLILAEEAVITNELFVRESAWGFVGQFQHFDTLKNQFNLKLFKQNFFRFSFLLENF